MSDVRRGSAGGEADPTAFPETVLVIDSHTEGEPTRVVVEGWPQVMGADMRARRDDMRNRFDHLRSAVVCEPRGHSAMVGALLTEPVTPDAVAGVIFFNSSGYLGMCGHGMIGVVRTLQHLGRLAPGPIVVDTPAGPVTAMLGEGGAITIRNVLSYCHARDVAVEVPEYGTVVGDVAYGGNWFFITQIAGLEIRPGNLDSLMHATRAICDALRDTGVTGADGAEIDHIELTGPPAREGTDSRNFVLCPSGDWDRSPCGTGTSAKVASLQLRGLLEPVTVWRQESVTGGVFDAWYEKADEGVIPFIRGHAHITGEGVLRFDGADPFRAGLPAT